MTKPLKVIHVVTLISPDGAYGGPVRVAVNQVRELLAAGHDVTLATSYLGYDEAPTEYDGVPVTAFPARRLVPGTGFAGLTAPGLHKWLREAVKTADIVHVHLARDLVTLPAANIARKARTPYVLQTHGMIDHSSNPLAAPLDKVWTVPVLKSAARIFHLTEREFSDVTQVGGEGLHLEHLVNGVPAAEDPAEGSESGTSFLYLARLQARKRPQAFVKAAIASADALPDATFDIVGPDEGEGTEVQQLIDQSGRSGAIRMLGGLPPEEVANRMRLADVYVLPSVNEPFPMSVLEAMSLGLPVIVTDTCGLAPSIDEAGAGIVVDAEQDTLDEAVVKLGTDSGLRERLGANALALTRQRYSMQAVAKQLESAYRSTQT